MQAALASILMKMRFMKSSRTPFCSRYRWVLCAALFASVPALAADVQLVQVLASGSGENQQFTDIAGLQLDANGTLILADGASDPVGRVRRARHEARNENKGLRRAVTRCSRPNRRVTLR